MGFKIHEHGALGCAFPFRPIIHAQDPQRRIGGWSRVAHHPNEGCWAGRHAESLAETRTSFSADGKGNHLQDIVQAHRFARQRRNRTGQPLRENALRAGRCATEKCANVPQKAHDIAAPGQVGRHTGLPTVHSERWIGTVGTGRAGLLRAKTDRERVLV